MNRTAYGKIVLPVLCLASALAALAFPAVPHLHTDGDIREDTHLTLIPAEIYCIMDYSCRGGAAFLYVSSLSPGLSEYPAAASPSDFYINPNAPPSDRRP